MKMCFAAVLTAVLVATAMGASIVHKEIELDHDGVHYKIVVDATKKHNGVEVQDTDESEEHMSETDLKNGLSKFGTHQEIPVTAHFHHDDEEEKQQGVHVHIELGSDHHEVHHREEHHGLQQQSGHHYLTHQGVQNYELGQHHDTGDNILNHYTHEYGSHVPKYPEHDKVNPYILGQYLQLSHHYLPNPVLQHQDLGDRKLKFIKLGHFIHGTDGQQGNHIDEDLSHYGHEPHGTVEGNMQFHVTKQSAYENHFGQQQGLQDQVHGVSGYQNGNILHVPYLQTMKPIFSPILHHYQVHH